MPPLMKKDSESMYHSAPEGRLIPQIKKLSQLAQTQVAKALIDPQPKEPSSRLKMAAKRYSDMVAA